MIMKMAIKQEGSGFRCRLEEAATEKHIFETVRTTDEQAKDAFNRMLRISYAQGFKVMNAEWEDESSKLIGVTLAK